MKKKTINNKKLSKYNESLQTNAQKRDRENLKDFKFSLGISSGKFYFISFCLLAVILVYIVFFFLQFFTNTIPTRNSSFINKQSKYRYERKEILYAPRGKILDANGKILAVSIPFTSFGLDVKVFLDHTNDNLNNPKTPKFQALAKALDMNPDDLYKQILSKPNSRYLVLKNEVSPTKSSYLESLHIPGLYSDIRYKRFYPYGNAISQLIGLLNNEGKPQFGIEALVDDQLKGKNGYVQYDKNFSGDVINYIASQDPVPGKDVRLTIDIDVQLAAFQAVGDAVRDNDANSATAVLVDVKTGRILAMANALSFNPNNRAKIDPSLLKNYAISSVFEPGSTVKPFVIYTGLKDGVIKPNTVVNTLPYNIGKYRIHDVAPRNSLSIRGILQKSSNVGVSKISLLLPHGDLRKTYLNAGFGNPTDLGLIGEITGSFPGLDQTETPLGRATFAYGYMQQVTPLQLAHAYTTLGDYGYKRPLSIIYDSKLKDGMQTLDPSIVKTVLHLMEGVAETGGGGIKAAINNYHVSIKTGTAKKTEHGVYVDKYISYTAGVAPSTNPRFALVIVIDNPRGKKYYGGAIAAPVWHNIMQYALRYYNIAEDNMSPNRVVLEPTLKQDYINSHQLKTK